MAGAEAEGGPTRSVGGGLHQPSGLGALCGASRKREVSLMRGERFQAQIQ